VKKIGIIVLIIGVIVTFSTGFSFFTREKVVDIGSVQISADKKHTVSWPPILGLVIVVAGAGIIFFGSRKA
jgi:divalent metal cation (Fe/Co/Zn/Cd) transporter